MHLSNQMEVTDFLDTIKKAKSDIYLCSKYGDRFNLKSIMSRYIALGELVKNETDLELFCSSKDDEPLFLKFFADHPETNK